MKVLGIETSCDETGIAIYDTEGANGNGCLLAHELYSQVKLHAEFGGVVPELASRDHIRKIIPLIARTLKTANLERSALDAIAYTAGPGLIGALLVGASVAKALAYSLDIPALGVHHMEGHLLAPMLEPKKPEFPFIALLVSGGHTMLVNVKGLGEYAMLGESLDDAAGEAFDKTAKILGLGYPGGPKLAKLAATGDPKRFHFPRPMTNRPGLDFSFSGLKTSALNTVEAHSPLSASDQADIAAAFQEAVVDTLVIKCRRAVEATGCVRLVIAGGVSANLRLREQLDAYGAKAKVEVYYPALEFCTDNGAMIAFAGAMRLKAGECDDSLGLELRARWGLGG